MKKLYIILLLCFFLSINELNSAVDHATINHSIVTVDFSKIQGHSITVDASNSDWKGKLPTAYNSEVYSSNEYIWYDAPYDDTGDGDYIYPLTNEIFTPQSADIKEFRVTYSNEYIYLYIETYGIIGIDWAPSMIIAIDTGTPDKGMKTFIEGDGNNPDLGPSVELGCDRILFDYLIYAYKTCECRLWNADGEQIGSKGFAGALNNILFQSPEWNQYEIAIPQTLIGNPTNAVWHFIVGAGHHEGYEGRDIMREIYPPHEKDPWHGGGGDLPRKDELGPDPDVYDLIGASQKLQEDDLGNYQKISFNASTEKGESINFQLSPNPYCFNKYNLMISFSLKIKSYVTLKILDFNGKKIDVIFNKKLYGEEKVLTFHEIEYNMAKESSNKIKKGLYFIQGIFESEYGKKVVNKMIRIY